MARVTTNGDEVAAWVAEILVGYNFETNIGDRSLGLDLAGSAAKAMIDRAADDGKDPDGVGYTPNEARYRARKRKDYRVDQPNVRTGQMLSITSMIGDTRVSADRVEMTYGIGAPPTSSLSGHITDADKRATDRDKGGWATDAGRRFYELGEAGESAVLGRADEALGAYLERGS